MSATVVLLWLATLAGLWSGAMTDGDASLAPEEWVGVSRCRLQCIAKFLVAAGRAHTEEECMADAAGCLDCWKWCESTRSRPTLYQCPTDKPAAEGTERCASAGCQAACTATAGLDKRFYAPGTSSSAWAVSAPRLSFHNRTLVYIDTEVTLQHAAMFVILYRLDASEPWAQLLSTFQQPIPVFGSFYKYPGLQLRLLTVTQRGVEGESTIDIYQLASQVTEAPTTTEVTSTAKSLPTHKGTHSYTTTSATTTAALDASLYQRIFNHLFHEQVYNLVAQREQGNSTGTVSRTAGTGDTGSLALYLAVGAACVLLLAVVGVGAVILRSNQRLAKTLSRHAQSFRHSFRRGLTRSVRRLRQRPAPRGFYDVEGAGSSEEKHAAPDQDQEVRPMVVPLLCVSTPNLHAANLLNVAPAQLRATSITSLRALANTPAADSPTDGDKGTEQTREIMPHDTTTEDLPAEKEPITRDQEESVPLNQQQN